MCPGVQAIIESFRVALLGRGLSDEQIADLTTDCLRKAKLELGDRPEVLRKEVCKLTAYSNRTGLQHLGNN